MSTLATVIDQIVDLALRHANRAMPSEAERKLKALDAAFFAVRNRLKLPPVEF